jgi:hypothetical protein
MGAHFAQPIVPDAVRAKHRSHRTVVQHICDVRHHFQCVHAHSLLAMCRRYFPFCQTPNTPFPFSGSATFVIESYPQYRIEAEVNKNPNLTFVLVEIIAVAIFTVEYVLRLLTVSAYPTVPELTDVRLPCRACSESARLITHAMHHR